MTVSAKKISGIILAAGTASRMGKIKQLLPLKDKPLLEHVIHHARQSNLYEIIVVLGYCAGEIENKTDMSGTRIIRNEAYLNGQSTSLIKGIENVSPSCDAAMFLLADQPFVNREIINHMISAFERSKKIIAVPYHKTKRGNPVIIDRTLFPELKKLSGDTGPRIYFQKFKTCILKVPVENRAVLLDIDTEEDYEKLKSGNRSIL